MGLEHWDPRRKKYVLYRNDDQHRGDCARFPFQSIPRRIFLDTNIINVLVKHSACVFEHELISHSTEEKLAIDIEALRHVFHVGVRANWDLVASPKTIEELSDTKDETLRDDLLDYGLGFVNLDPNCGERRHAVGLGRRIIDSSFVAALPDVADRELIGNAIGFGCDAFCTRDEATIVRRRNKLRQVPLRVLTPVEWWACIKPWAGLWY